MSVLALPYVSLPTLPVELPRLGSLTITVFGPLVAIGIIVGYRAAMAYAARQGLDDNIVDRLVVWVAAGGLLMAHWVAVFAYHPESVLTEPWILVQVHRGIASTGGFVGGALTFAWLCRRWRLDPIRHADAIAYGLLLAFSIGRIGCSLVHDHPGAVVSQDVWLAVGPWPDGTYRVDLGLTELLLVLAPIGAYVYGFARRSPPPPGALTVRIAIAYCSLRFWLDFLRAEDARYGLLTPGQYACIGLLLAALVLHRVRRSPRTTLDG